MKKTILTILGTALLASSIVQVASAAERHRVHRVERAPAVATEQFRNSNAAWPAPTSDWSRYEGGGISAPAGH
jgi:hypothetical protein